MKILLIGATAIALVTSPVAIAQSGNHRGQWNDNQQHEGRWNERSGRYDNGRHRGWGKNRGHGHRWRRGQRMGYNDWNDSRRIDYRRYNLRQPPRGYEWRRDDDRYIMAAVATGLIVSVILSNDRRRY